MPFSMAEAMGERRVSFAAAAVVVVRHGGFKDAEVSYGESRVRKKMIRVNRRILEYIADFNTNVS